jgi:hypothetical protein
MSKTDRFPKLVPQSELDRQVDRSVPDLVIGALCGSFSLVLGAFAKPAKRSDQAGSLRLTEQAT